MKFFLACAVMLCLAACNNDRLAIGRKAISNLSEEYRCTGFLDNIGEYKFARGVSFPELDIQLWMKQSDGRECIVVFIHNGKGYAIPMLPNIYKKYWNFQFDDNATDTSKMKITFEGELSNMVQTLGILDSARLRDCCLYGLFNPMLLYGKGMTLSKSDSLDIIKNSFTLSEYDFGETQDSCQKRKVRILKEVYKTMRNSKYCFASFSVDYDAFVDYHNDKIYQYDFDSAKYSKPFNPCLKVYRLECMNGKEYRLIL